MLTNKETKRLIRGSRTFEQADNVLSNTWCKTENEKIDYLCQLFPKELEGIERSGSPEEDYKIFVMSVIHSEDNQPYMWGYKDGYKKGLEDGCDDAVQHILKDWNVLRNMSLEGITEHFRRILHKDQENVG